MTYLKNKITARIKYLKVYLNQTKEITNIKDRIISYMLHELS